MRHLLYFLVSVILYANSELPTLEILPKPHLISTVIGKSLRLTCKTRIENPNRITQQEWRDPENNTIDENPESHIYVQKVSGTAILVFTKVDENHQGKYVCSAKFSDTKTVEASIIVEPVKDITFLDAPEWQFARFGYDYLIRCLVSNPAAEMVWLKDNKSIVSPERYIISNKGLLVRNIKESDNGMYTCRAFVADTDSVKERKITVEVQAPPTLEDMEEISVFEGQQASIQCKASGIPPPQYKWFKELEDLSTNDRFEVHQDIGVFIINQAEYNDTGVYKCIARNPAGYAETTVAINVSNKPSISKD